jgi:hypothetical protein
MNEESAMAKYIIYGLDGDPEFPCLNSCLNSTDMGPYVLNVVGAGNPFYAFESLPPEVLTAEEFGADFNGAPLASTDWQTNRMTVAAQYASPVPAGETNNGINKVWKVA